MLPFTMLLPHAVLSLLLFSPSPIVAAPHASHRYTSDLTAGAPRPWRKLSDAIIRKVWSLPESQKSGRVNTDASRAPNSAPGSTLLALYGGDIVLRFTIRTAQEATALAEASRILFLDVWEFNADWVDIRLAKDTVSSYCRIEECTH
jgi:extracellular matrix protein 14